MPAIVRHGCSGPVVCVSLIRRPIGSSWGNSVRAVVSFTNTTGADCSSSDADGNWPRTSGIPRLSKYPGVTTYQSAAPGCRPFASSGRPSMSKLQSPDPYASGSPVPAPADSTPGNVRMLAMRRVKNSLTSGRPGYRAAGNETRMVSTREGSMPAGCNEQDDGNGDLADDERATHARSR